MSEQLDLSHHFLIAMPALADSWFERAVIYLLNHDEEGATGVVVNRALPDFGLKELLDEVEIPNQHLLQQQPVMLGGPVSVEQVFLLHKRQDHWQHSLHNHWLSLTASRDALSAVASGFGPEPVMPLIGYSGWGAGQLEEEIADNAWLTVAADETIIFETNIDDRYEAAVRLLGFDPAWLASTGGHA
ncbi:YqgE/AlgH family protein [Salinibius halmophilus]|uniref:YqgE/AlgH family protein n=1 Tax=Salinibius halmophilus TaxID=1853216 RepID=UPI000E66756F|nr:YqgE/AlgH family protein [Salinibius halmophilus]